MLFPMQTYTLARKLQALYPCVAKVKEVTNTLQRFTTRLQQKNSFLVSSLQNLKSQFQTLLKWTISLSVLKKFQGTNMS